MERKVFVVETIVGLILWKKEIKGLSKFWSKAKFWNHYKYWNKGQMSDSFAIRSHLTLSQQSVSVSEIADAIG